MSASPPGHGLCGAFAAAPWFALASDQVKPLCAMWVTRACTYVLLLACCRGQCFSGTGMRIVLENCFTDCVLNVSNQLACTIRSKRRHTQ